MEPIKVICKDKSGDEHSFWYVPMSAPAIPITEALINFWNNETQSDQLLEFEYEYLTCDQDPAHTHKYYLGELKQQMVSNNHENGG